MTCAKAEEALERARNLSRSGEDEAARLAYLEVVRWDPTNVCALIELGNLALAGGFREAAFAIDANMHEVHEGIQWVLKDIDPDAAERHRIT